MKAGASSFCVSFENLEAAVIAELHKTHPDALPVSVEWKLSGSGGSAVVWWVESPEKKVKASE